MKPTFYLRYIEVEELPNTPQCISYQYDNQQFTRLQQWWEDEQGNGEWRFVDIDFLKSDNKPY